MPLPAIRLSRKVFLREPSRNSADEIPLEAVVLGQHVLTGLQQHAVGPISDVAGEQIASQDDPLGEHDRGARGVLGEGVVLEPIVVRIHVVQPVARPGHLVAHHQLPLANEK